VASIVHSYDMILRKRHFIIVLSLLAVGITYTGCSSGPEPLFEIPIEARFTMQPALDNFQTHYLPIRRVPTFYQTFVTGNEDAIDHINGGRGTITAQFNNIDWGIVREVEIHISSPAQLESSKEVFYQDRIQLSGVEELRLFSSLPDVKDILLQDFIDIEVRFNFRRITIQEVDVVLNLNFVAYGAE